MEAEDRRDETREPNPEPVVPDSGEGVSIPDAPEIPRLDPKLPRHPTQARPPDVAPGAYGKMAIASTAATSLIMPIIVFAVGGMFLDRKLHTDPWGAFIGVVLGFVAGIAALMNVMRRLGE